VHLATAGTKSSPPTTGTVTLVISDANIPVILSLDLNKRAQRALERSPETKGF